MFPKFGHLLEDYFKEKSLFVEERKIWNPNKNALSLASLARKCWLQKRAGASSVVLNPSTLWVVGGEGEHYDDISSTEMITLDQPPAKGPELTFTISDHGMVKYLSLIHI